MNLDELECNFATEHVKNKMNVGKTWDVSVVCKAHIAKWSLSVMTMTSWLVSETFTALKGVLKCTFTLIFRKKNLKKMPRGEHAAQQNF